MFMCKTCADEDVASLYVQACDGMGHAKVSDIVVSVLGLDSGHPSGIILSVNCC